MTCKVKVTAGAVEVSLAHADHAGPCPLYRRAERLLLAAAGVAAVIGPADPEGEPEPERALVGFAAHVERAPEFVDRDRADWFEESP
jgi:hypothetical protein